MKKKQTTVRDYATLVENIKKRVCDAQLQALKTVNRELIMLYWDIGKAIIERQKTAGKGKAVVERLADDLQAAFPDMRGFSARNIWHMRELYDSYGKNPKLQSLTAEISWTHHVTILSKCKEALEREFYIRMTRKHGWSVRVLANHIDDQTYEKTFLNQTSFDKTLPEPLRTQAKLLVKDEYTFDFLELGPEHSERQLETALVSKVEPFLREMGGVFAFIGTQYRLEVDDEEYFIDILLFHRHLKCLVAIELKIGKFVPEYVGKMQFYLAALDDMVKIRGENPSIGIILCKTKTKTTVEYALRETKKPIGVAAYRLVKKLPKELKEQLPSAEQIALLLKEIE